MKDSALVCQIAFASLRGMNVMKAREVLSLVGGEERFFELSDSALTSVMGGGCRMFDARHRAQALERARREEEFILSNTVRPLYFRNSDYPHRLLAAPDAPLMLYSYGPADVNEGHMVGIVGTRHATPYGSDFVGRLVEDLQAKLASEVTIVSGLAFGIDAAAHAAALRAGIPTIGVLAHGLNTIYPSQHRSMAADMVRGCGGLITEYGVTDAVHKGNFVARNRIVAAMCDCLVVAESARKGGAMITADLAIGYDRELFALPGRISDRYSEGCNALIADSRAHLISGSDDLIAVMGWAVKPTTEEAGQPSLFVEVSPDEQRVIDFLTASGEGQVNQMAVALNMNIGRLMGLMIDMESKKLILAHPGGKYRLA